MVSKVRTIVRHVLPRPARDAVLKAAHTRGLMPWATKGFEVWLIVQHLLLLLRPQAMVEFGSGRSTDYLAEYAHKSGCRLMSIEENWIYVAKVNLALRLLMTRTNVVRHVPVKGEWYDHARFDRLLDAFGPADFVFIDGPVDREGRERAAIERHLDRLIDLAEVKLVLLDDTQRPEVKALALRIAERFGLVAYDLADTHKEGNALTFLLAPGHTAALDALAPSLRALLEPVAAPAAATDEPALT
ncbi:hypothetical protein [Marinivivus vitaminiproducens]|uniref:hypothetical protein n=1 Tax=Marinivivus vitaminiproducens TaxID=3035935 RepID=UPI0027981FE6|nr:hypothetical protein P4R82_08065 [Geminicoccaceae bacterium SCSIO 64248]